MGNKVQLSNHYRGLTIIKWPTGRVNIVKTLAISKLTFICSVLDTPKGFTDEVNNIIFHYIWKYKNPKLKKNPLSSKIRRMESLIC